MLDLLEEQTKGIDASIGATVTDLNMRAGTEIIELSCK